MIKIIMTNSQTVIWNENEFDDYMLQQTNDNQYPLNDGDFSSDELINDDLCATNILDEIDY